MPDFNFIRDFVLYNEATEVPDIFALWCGVAGVSAALGRKVYLDMGNFTLFPNFYIVLVAGSGRCRKSTAVNQIAKVIRQMQPLPNLISQRITPEALIEAIRTQDTTDPSRLLKESCTGFVCVDELASFLNRKVYDAGLGPLLIQLYDCVEEYEYRTKGRGIEKITDACLGMLGASTVDWIRNAIPEDAIGGGLTSRIIFVYVHKPPPPVARPIRTAEKQALFERMVKAIQEIQILKGPVQLTEGAWELYTNEYKLFYDSSTFYNEKELSGYASRRHVHLLKLGIVFAASQGGLVVDQGHLEGAKALLETAEKHLKMILDLVTATEEGSNLSAVKDAIGENKNGISRSGLIRRFAHRINSRQLGEFIDTLNSSGQLEVSSNGKDVFYRLRGR